MKNEWRFIRSGLGAPDYNMAVDEAILTAHSEGLVPPTVRFYGWKPATLSVGFFQKAASEVDFDALKREGIGFVRRATGGRAVLHDQELTYSMIVSENYPGIPRSVTEAYRVLSEGLLLGFRKLGLSAEMVQLENEEEKEKYASMGSAACFDSPSWYELVVEGRKVAGSAQTRQKGVVLQHGSILLDLDADQLFRLLRFPSERVMERMKQQFLKKAVAINEVRNGAALPRVDLAEVEEAFTTGIEEGLAIRLVPAELSDYELELVERLMVEKYGNSDWNLRR
ncbi:MULTISPECIES: biotin/lipoate A/B protein ligase family protein [unclassified Paenibacillus]|uniref:lipoate--protein ligase family protein n=1 Tax=unclassified Paenibacillus TaxID=185978 RepID=UPI001AE6B9B1|nr:MULTISPECIES: biotin/lipoate A/B protein ligase family protein [unclassified Paenibacillus]MBP1154829.1 lipoate-protein ligase A [Paenibacillus sp. PvP091]MBP1169787.1 lipoate-protein ligase A [Paenibacillus sp. PvR098]MBP2440815.1 lipoate-protein ligase A [Paenibacillus sp. PvP052]